MGITCFLICHEESAEGREDAYRVLTKTGIRQAVLTGQPLNDHAHLEDC